MNTLIPDVKIKVRSLNDFQMSIYQWMRECFGLSVVCNIQERNFRFIEEAMELVQSLGCTKTDVQRVMDYVYDRPKGDPAQEVGGVMVTLAGLCSITSLDMSLCAEQEGNRIWNAMDAIRAKQQTKPVPSGTPFIVYDEAGPIQESLWTEERLEN